MDNEFQQWLDKHRNSYKLKEIREERRKEKLRKKREFESKKERMVSVAGKRQRAARLPLVYESEDGSYLFTIGAAAKKCGLTAATIMVYERSGFILPPLRHPENNFRLYTERQVNLIRKLCKKKARRDKNIPEFLLYIKDTWTDIDPRTIVLKPEKYYITHGHTVGTCQRKSHRKK